MSIELSFRSRARALLRLRSEVFDLVIVGGGITGAAIAREAARRGLEVALVERRDFATGASSASSKLVHGGLRYLANFEFSLVFEALRERARLLREQPQLVRPMPFYLPTYEGEKPGRALLAAGLATYDLLAVRGGLPRHRRLSREALLDALPTLESQGLSGGFRYFDAATWDDALVVRTLQEAAEAGAALASYVEMSSPLDDGHGLLLEDAERPGKPFAVRARQVVIATGAWTDLACRKLDPHWRDWMRPSKGVHLVIPLERLPLPGAVLLQNHDDGRASFVVPRPDAGSGVVLVGTTDGPSPRDPSRVAVEPDDVRYLLGLLARYFPHARISSDDILSAFAGVRPLVADEAASLHRASREHRIDVGPRGAIVVAGGKLTTHRSMAVEALELAEELGRIPRGRKAPRNEKTSQELADVPSPLASRYGADAPSLVRHVRPGDAAFDAPGFPHLAAQLRHAVRHELVMHLDDFYFRRVPLFLARADHGLPFASGLARVWAEARGLPTSAAEAEVRRLEAAVELRSAWRAALDAPRSVRA